MHNTQPETRPAPKSEPWGTGAGRAARLRPAHTASGAGAACSARESPGPEVRERSGGALCGRGHLPELPVPGLHSLQAWKDRACRDCVGQASRSRYLRALQSGEVTRRWLPAGPSRNTETKATTGH